MEMENELKLQNKVNSLDFEKLNDVWRYTEENKANKETYIIRGAIMKRLEETNKIIFEKWLETEASDLEMFKEVL